MLLFDTDVDCVWYNLKSTSQSMEKVETHAFPKPLPKVNGFMEAVGV